MIGSESKLDTILAYVNMDKLLICLKYLTDIKCLNRT